MTTTFYDSHLDTLVKLKALAEKHGMKIRFGTTNDFKVERDLSMLDEYVATEILEDLDDYYHDIVDGEIMRSEETLWFELYDPQPKEKQPKYHVMTYKKLDISFRLKDDWDTALDNAKLDYGYQEDLSDDEDESDVDLNAIENIDKLIKFIEDKQGDWQGVSFSSSPTLIYGFGNSETVTDHRVYRDGMALHFFTELVCEYLKEPMIHNTY